MNFVLLLSVLLLTGCKALNPNAYADQSAAMNACQEKGQDMPVKRWTCQYDNTKGSYYELLVPPKSSGLGLEPHQRFWF